MPSSLFALSICAFSIHHRPQKKIKREDPFDSLVSKYRKQMAASSGTARWFDK
jgi:hypothetical protein